MRESLLLVIGIWAIVISIIYLFGNPMLIKKEYRTIPKVNRYMRQQCVFYAIMGIMMIIYAFQEDPAIYNKPFAIVTWGVILIALLGSIYSNCWFVKPSTHTIEIIIPAGSTEAFVYSDEEISSQKDTLTISTKARIATMEVILKSIEGEKENVYESATLKQEEHVKMDVEKGAWFKIGVAVQNPSERDIVIAIEAENVEVRSNQ